MGQTLPAGKEPQNGSCSFVWVFGPGVYHIARTEFTNSASGSFDRWKCDSPSEIVVIEEQTVVGPTTISIAGSLSIGFEKIGGNNRP